MKIIFLLGLSFACCFNVYASTQPQRLFDMGDPIELSLPLNKEVSLAFDSDIKSIAIKGDVRSMIDSESVDRRWWIKATASFTDTKVLVKNDLGKILVFILSSDKNIPIVNTKYKVITKRAKLIKVADKNLNQARSLSLVDLTRFAAQKLYAPLRLIENINLNKVPVNLQKINLFTCQTNTWCVDTSAQPLASWTDGKRYISAIEIKNISGFSIDLDPRSLTGKFVSATFQFNRIGRLGSNTDTTVLYVVTTESLEQSL